MTTILIIEDNPYLRDDLAELLILEGFAVITAKDGLEGIILATSAQPNLILSDIDMPGLNGYDVLRTLRQNPLTADIPFLFLSAAPDSTRIMREFGLAAQHILKKPFGINNLMQYVKSLLPI